MLTLVGNDKDKMEKEEKKRRSEGKMSDVRVHGFPRSTHIYGYTYVDVCTLPDRCTERPTAMFLMEAYLFPANAIIRRMASNLIILACLYVRVSTVLVIGLRNPSHICYHNPYVLLQTHT